MALLETSLGGSVLAASEPQAEELVSFRRVREGMVDSSSFGLEVFDEFVRLENVYGNKLLEKDELAYLLKTAFPPERQLAPAVAKERISMLGCLVARLSTDQDVDALVASIEGIGGFSRERILKMLTLKNGNLMKVKSLLEETVAKDGRVTIEDGTLSREVVYRLAKVENLSPEMYRRYAEQNPMSLDNAIDALKYRKGRLVKYVLALADAVADMAISQAQKNTHRLCLMELCEYLGNGGAEALRKRMYHTFGAKVGPNGRLVYSAAIGSLKDGVLRRCIQCQRLIEWRKSYAAARSNQALKSIFSKPTKTARIAEDKAWLLYRYHGELLLPLLQGYCEQKKLVLSREAELETVLSEALEHGRVLAVYLPDYQKATKLIRKYATSGTSPRRQVNVLFLFEHIASEQDATVLSALAKSGKMFKWQRDGKHFSGPLIAVRAVRILEKLEDRTTLADIAQSENVLPRVRKMASAALDRLQPGNIKPEKSHSIPDNREEEESRLDSRKSGAAESAQQAQENMQSHSYWLAVGVPAAALSLCGIIGLFACKSKKQRLACAIGAAVFAGIAAVGIARSYRGAVPGDALSRDPTESESVPSEAKVLAKDGRRNSRDRSVRNRQTFTRPEDMGEDVSDFKEQKLVGMLANSEDRIERRKAARELGNRQMTGDLNGWSEHQQATVDEVVGGLVANLAKRDNDLRSEAKHQIHRLWRLAVPELLKRVGQPYAGAAEEAGECLSLMRNEDIVEKLVKKARAAKTEREKKWWIFILSDFMKQRTSVIKGRGCIGNEESIRLVRKYIIPWLKRLQKVDEPESVQKTAARAISKLRRLIENPPPERKSTQKT